MINLFKENELIVGGNSGGNPYQLSVISYQVVAKVIGMVRVVTLSPITLKALQQ